MPGTLSPTEVSFRSNGLLLSSRYGGSVTYTRSPPGPSRSPSPFTRPTTGDAKPRTSQIEILVSEKKRPSEERPTIAKRVVSSLLLPLEPSEGGDSPRGRSRPSLRHRSHTYHHTPRTGSPWSSVTSSSQSTVTPYTHTTSKRSSHCTPKPTFITLPNEILTQIVSHLPQSDLLTLTHTSKRLLPIARPILYHAPTFSSTYRFAQFVTSITRSTALGFWVRELDLSSLAKIAVDANIATWREWKFRNNTLYAAPAKLVVEQDGKVHSRRTANQHLQKYSDVRDVPIGSILHLLHACPRLHYVNLSNVSIAADYAVSRTTKPTRRPLISNIFARSAPAPLPMMTTNLLFASDIPRQHNWDDGELRSVKPTELVDGLCRLDRLKVLKLRKALWLNANMGQRLLENGSLQWVDLRGSGMQRDAPWATVGTRDEVAKYWKQNIAVEEDENH